MVYIHHQTGLLLGSHNLKAIERTRSEVERTYEVVLICLQLLLAHLLHRNLYCLFQIDGLNDTILAIAEMYSHLWMSLHKSLDSIDDGRTISILGETNLSWNII